MGDPDLGEAYELDSIESVSEGTFGCVLKVKIKEEFRMAYRGSEVIAVKVEQLGDNGHYNSLPAWRESLSISSKVSTMKNVLKVNPFVATVFKGYYSAISESVYNLIENLTKNCSRLIDGINKRMDTDDGRFMELFFDAEKSDDGPNEELIRASQNRWDRILYVDKDFSIGFIEMEYVEGGTLRNMLERGELSKKDITQLHFQLCWSLYTMQREFEITHFDIKPLNILVGIVKEDTTYFLKLNKEEVFKVSMKAGDYQLMIADFGVSEVKGEGPVDAEHEMGNPIFSPPTFTLLWRMFDRKNFGMGRGPDSDVWMLGQVMCSMALNGWKMPDNEMNMEYFTLDHVGEIFIPDKRGGRGLDEYKPAEEFATFIISHVKEFNSPDDAEEVSSIRHYFISREITLITLLATCQFQYFAGNGFLPDPENIPLKRVQYELGSISKVIDKEKDHILDLGVRYANGKENIFLSAVRHIKEKRGEMCFDFVKRHLGWLPEQRRVNTMEYYEAGAFMKNSLLHGYFQHLRSSGEGSNRRNSYGYSNDLPDPRYNTILLGISVDPYKEHFIRVNDDGTSSVVSLITNRATCSHTIDKNSMFKWLKEKRSLMTQKLCPMCEILIKK